MTYGVDLCRDTHILFMELAISVEFVIASGLTLIRYQ